MKVFPVTAKSRDTLEALGEQILSEFDPEALVHPKAIKVEELIDTFLMKKYSWSLDVREDLPEGILGVSDPKTKSVGISEQTYSGILQGAHRPRFTGCHEFSHVVLHRAQMRRRMISLDEHTDSMFRTERISLKAFNDPEWQADYLAGVLLMPKKMVWLLMRSYSGDALIQKMMAVFKVSKAAAEIRLRKLK